LKVIFVLFSLVKVQVVFPLILVESEFWVNLFLG
jgi:hypothetical protein